MKNLYVLCLLLMVHLASAQNALHFDGVDDYVNCGNNPSLQISGHLTLEAWIYANSWKPGAYQGNIINKEQNIPDYGYMLRTGDGGKINFNIGNGSWHEINTAALMSLNTWHHVAATYDGSKMRVYLDGVRVDSLSVSMTIGNSTSNLFIGNWHSSGRNFNGIIEEVRVWNVARSQAEIVSTKDQELCTLPAGLVAYYTFDQGVAGGNNAGLTQLNDQSGHANHGTLTNFSLSDSTSNWVAGNNLPGGSTSSSITLTACNTYTSPSGNHQWNTSGTYSDTLVNAAGCDSVITIDLTVIQVDVALGISAGTLFSNAINAYYQWLDCDNGMTPIPGATFQQFTPTVPGNYACEVIQYGCKDTTICVPVTTVGSREADPHHRLSVFPNPTADGYVFLSRPINEPYRMLQVFDLSGREIEAEIIVSDQQLRVRLPREGVFLIRSVTDTGMAQARVVNTCRK